MNFFRKVLAWFGPKYEPDQEAQGSGSGSGPNGEYTEADVAVMNHDRHLELEAQRRYHVTWENQRVIEVDQEGRIHVGTVTGFHDDQSGLSKSYRAIIQPVGSGKPRTVNGALFVFHPDRLKVLCEIPSAIRFDIVYPLARERGFIVKPAVLTITPPYNFGLMMKVLNEHGFLTDGETLVYVGALPTSEKRATPPEVSRVKVSIGELAFRDQSHKDSGAPYVVPRNTRKAPTLAMARINTRGNYVTVDKVVWEKLVDQCRLPQYLKEPGPHNSVSVTSSVSEEFQAFLHRYENMEIRHLARWFDYWCNQEVPDKVIIVE